MHRRRYLALSGLATGLAGCMGDDDTNADDEDGDSSDDGDADPEDTGNASDDGDDGDGAEPAEVDAVIGDLVEGENLHLVVEETETSTSLGESPEADDGNEFLTVQLAMKNVTDSFVHVSQLLQASIQDDEDYSYSTTVAGVDEPTFNDGQFAPGEVERGLIIFELPTDATGRRLLFDLDDAIFGGIERAEIDLEDSTEVATLSQDLGVEPVDVGESVTYEGVTVEVREVDTTTELGSFAQAADGHEYVVVDIAVTNETGEERRVSTILQMLLKDGDGWSHQEDWTAAAQLDRGFDESSPIADGETRAGQVAYEVETDLSALYWVFEFTLWTEGDKTFWQIR